MDFLALDARREMGKAVQLRFGGTPVIAVDPVIHELAQVTDVHAIAPVAVVCRRLGPAGIGEPAADALDRLLGDVDSKGLHAHGALLCVSHNVGLA